MDPTILAAGLVISGQQCIDLCRPVSSEDIKKEIFSIGNDKSTGLDGFSAKFFNSAWEIVGQDVCTAAKAFFRNRKMPKSLNSTTIILIPKSSNPLSALDFRPIACCNIIYKAISIIVASRLNSVLEDIVALNQDAFIPNKNIMHNILLIQELICHYNRKNISPRCALKVDLKKVYDSVSWSFLFQILEGIGLPFKLIKWIKECVSYPNYSILFNGGQVGYFPGKRGLRQGGPLFPYLFSLVMEYFSRSLKIMAQNQLFHFHPKCRRLKITHLSYADDLIMFTRGDSSSTQLVKETLLNFSQVSGLQVNDMKSQTFFRGIP
eukprot:TRINITY_DN8833_c0_g1_i5.p1 TRINITY_DN8833_c0_g1~~TRINITY_DN8833_c0_g1_i5.p1  ORF type:complete len:321 (+),score=23.36 TRINITY_DN8833_c0_g1_i5:1134-2096(+)